MGLCNQLRGRPFQLWTQYHPVRKRNSMDGNHCSRMHKLLNTIWPFSLTALSHQALVSVPADALVRMETSLTVCDIDESSMLLFYIGLKEIDGNFHKFHLLLVYPLLQ